MLLPANRLKKNQDFRRVLRYGRYFDRPYLRLTLIANNKLVSRFGVVVGLVVSKKATQRNLLRRRLSEILRLKIKKGQIKTGADVLIKAKPAILSLNYRALDEQLTELLGQVGLLQK